MENGPHKSLRVLLVTPRHPLGHGGVERHVREVSRRLVSRGVEVTVVCAQPGGAGGDELWEGVAIRSVRAWPRHRDWCFAPQIWSELARREPDVIHVQSYHTLVAPLAMMRALTLRLPYCVTFHGGGHSSRLRNRLRRMQLGLLRPLLVRSEGLVVVARFEIDHYGRRLHLPPHRFQLIPNGTDPAMPADAADNPSNGLLLASIGRLERYKGHHRVIAALPYVLESRADATLLVVGVGPYERELRRRAAELGVAERVQFTSTAPDNPEAMTEILSRVSLVALMSEFETHPLVALEAAAARRRIVVSDGTGLRELAQEGLARAVPPDASAASLGLAILEELAKPAPAATPTLTSWDQCVDQLLALYQALARP